MDLLKPVKAIVKYGARTISDKSFNKIEKEVQKSTYCAVGNKIAKAKKEGKRFDASKTYERTYQRKLSPLVQKKNRRDKFIDEI